MASRSRWWTHPSARAARSPSSSEPSPSSSPPRGLSLRQIPVYRRSWFRPPRASSEAGGEKKKPNKHENECRFRLRQQRSASRLLIGGASINMQSCTSNHLIHASPHPHHVSIPRVPVFSCFWAGSERLEKHGRAWLVQRAWQWGRGVGDRDCLFVGVRSFEGGGGVVGQKRGGACVLNTTMRSSRCHWLRKGRWPSKPIKN